MAKRSQLRITGWPGGSVPVPLVPADPVELVDGEWLRFDLLRAAERELPDQAYLYELADVDLRDPAAIAAAVKTAGRMTPLTQFDRDRDLPGSSETGTTTGAIARHSAENGRDYRRSEDDLERWHDRVHVDETGYRLRVLQALRRHVLAHAAGEPLAPAWRNTETDVEAWDHFCWHANAALQPFHVRVTPLDRQGRPLGLSGPNPTAYEAAVLQLVNDLMIGTEFKVCAAEGCGRLFARQRGRSTHYNRSTGVVYCSQSCGNAQAQREYRRRRRAEKG